MEFGDIVDYVSFGDTTVLQFGLLCLLLSFCILVAWMHYTSKGEPKSHVIKSNYNQKWYVLISHFDAENWTNSYRKSDLVLWIFIMKLLEQRHFDTKAAFSELGMGLLPLFARIYQKTDKNRSIFVHFNFTKNRIHKKAAFLVKSEMFFVECLLFSANHLIFDGNQHVGFRGFCDDVQISLFNKIKKMDSLITVIQA